MSTRFSLLPLVAAALLASAGCSDAQGSADAYPELDPELARIGQVNFRALPGDDRVSPELRRLAIGEALAIVTGAEPFGDKAAAFTRLAEDPAFAAEPEAVQMITGIALNWMNNNAPQWRGSEAAVRDVVGLHAANGGVMYEAMVDAVRRLEADGPDVDLAPTRAAVVAAFALRQDQCADCDLAVPAEASDPGALPAAIREQVLATAERRTRALDRIADWQTN